MPLLQEVIHKIETGASPRVFRTVLAVAAILFLTVGYNWRAFRNMNTQEAMDAAQVARNLAQGKGFTTYFVRPFSIFLVKRHNMENASGSRGNAADPGRIKGMHPDLANAPVYPLVLAGLMKVLPFHYTVDTTHAFWSGPPVRAEGKRVFSRHEPDFLISLFNQLLFFGVVVLTFFLARRLFDARVGWLSAALLLCTEMFWRFAVSGLSTMLLVLLFVGLAGCLVLLESEAREPRHSVRWLYFLAGLAGLLVGVGALTRYSFGWLIFPVVVFVIVFGGRQRIPLALLTLFVFLGAMAPWVARNYRVSGTPFGTAGYAVVEDTILFPENRLQRSLEPDIRLYLPPFWNKLITNSRQIVQSEVPRLGGGWITALFLTGLLVGFRNPAVRRLRYFLLGSLLVLVIIQAMGRTQLSDDSPEINSENLLVLLAPLVLVYGVSLFFLLLDQIELPLLPLRYAVTAVFSAVVCLPMVYVFLPPRTNPVAFPPYYPPVIQEVAGWLKPNELSMSDVPWAVAWYGQRQSVWLTLKCTADSRDRSVHEDFFAINDYQKPINVLYLTPRTMDARFLSQWIKAGEQSWASFVLDCIVKKRVPEYFPLNESQYGFMPDQLVLADWRRWSLNH